MALQVQEFQNGMIISVRSLKMGFIQNYVDCFLKQIVGQFEFEVVSLTENYRKDSGEVLWKISSKWKS